MLNQLIINLADILFIAVLILFAFFGWKNGFVKMGFGLLSFLIAIMLGRILYPHCSAFLRNTPIYEGILSLAQKNGVDNVIAAEQGFFADLIAKSGELVTTYLADILLNVLAFLLVVILVKLLLFFVSKILNLFSKLPVISFVNRIAGLFAGLCEGILILMVALALIQWISPLRENPVLEREIEKSVIVYQMYYENPLLTFIK